MVGLREGKHEEAEDQDYGAKHNQVVAMIS